MYRILLIIFICHEIFFVSKNNETKYTVNILFVGNSLTTSNNMPSVLQSMLDSSGRKYYITTCAISGTSLSQHLNNVVVSESNETIYTRRKGQGDSTLLEKLLQQKRWDFIVLQDGNYNILIPEARNLILIPAINEIKKSIKDSKCRFILFKLWPTQDSFPKKYCNPSFKIDPSIKASVCCSNEIKTLEDEFKFINDVCDSIAKVSSLETVPITDCYKYVLKKYYNTKLYDDWCHPSKYGAYLNACVFYKYFTKRNAQSIKEYSNIEKETAIKLQKAVDSIF